MEKQNDKSIFLQCGGSLFWLFQTTRTLHKLGTLASLLIKRNNNSNLSYVKITAVNPRVLGAIVGKNNGEALS